MGRGMLWVRWPIVSFLCLWAAHAARAEVAPTVIEVVDRIQESCARAQELSARFQQTITNKSLGQVLPASGILLLKRPGKMRWEYQKPEPRLFVTDGKMLWDYSPADKQVKVLKVDEAFSSRLPFAFLAGDCQLRREFEISKVENAATRAANIAILDLRPKHPELGISRMLLEVNLQTYVIQRTTLFDAAGNTTVIALTHLKLNSGLSDQQFEFAPPAGVTVVTPPSR